MLTERRDFRKVSASGLATGNPRERASDSPPPQRGTRGNVTLG